RQGSGLTWRWLSFLVPDGGRGKEGLRWRSSLGPVPAQRSGRVELRPTPPTLKLVGMVVKDLPSVKLK
ncbi:unnamed protein product, partial [Musa textilis]